MSESEKEFTIEEILKSIKSLSSQIENTKLVTDVGLSNKSSISKTEEEAISRADYEDYMKTSEIDQVNIDKAIDNIVKNLQYSDNNNFNVLCIFFFSSLL